jgi:hypothetical protein
MAIAWPGTAAAAPAPLSSGEIIAALNQERKALGLPTVRQDGRLSAGCAAHNRYLIKQGPRYLLSSGHFEDPHRPGYSKAGDHAARTSVLAWGSSDGWAHGDPWATAPFHHFQVLNPEIQATGADERPMNLGAPYGQVMLECMNTLAAPLRKRPGKLHVYFVPNNGGTVPSLQLSIEGSSVFGTAPNTKGPPVIFVYFFGRGVNHVRIVSAKGTFDGTPLGVPGQYVGGASGPGGASGGSGFFSIYPAAAFGFDSAPYLSLLKRHKQPLDLAVTFSTGGARRQAHVSAFTSGTF